MQLILALFLPWLTFFTVGRPFAGVICLLLQLTLFGWLPATVWALYTLSRLESNQKIRRAVLRLS